MFITRILLKGKFYIRNKIEFITFDIVITYEYNWVCKCVKGV